MRKLLDLLLAALVAIVILCAAFFGFVYYIMIQNGPDAATYNKKIAPKKARVIIGALNKYARKHDEYPYQIIGGMRYPWRRGFESSTEPGEWAQDPLIEGGYLRSYPAKVGPYAARTGIVPDPRVGRMVNLVSTPDDLFVQWCFQISQPAGPSELGAMKEDAVALAVRGDKQAIRFLKWQKLQGNMSVLLAAGGISEVNKGQRFSEGSAYSVIPAPVKAQIKDALSINEYPRGIQQDFGYVRGDRMGGDKQSAFIWIYGAFDDVKKRAGLDVLNAETGELKPDGIPDGIVLLYELRDGQVVKTTRAEDM